MAEKVAEMADHSARSDDVPADTITATTENQIQATDATQGTPAEPIAERRSKRPRTGSSDKQPTDSGADDACRACGTTDPTLTMLKCASCHGGVHARCYLTDKLLHAPESMAPWTCDSCLDNANEASRVCVFCRQPGDTCMRRVETAHWPTAYRTATTEKGESVWAHALCALWDPFSPAAEKRDTAPSDAPSEQPVDAGSIQTESTTATQPSTSHKVTTMANKWRARLELPVPACSFCNGSEGVRIQCRHLHCGRFFHARCAHASDKGHIKVGNAPFPLKYAYCDRHSQSQYDIRALTTKLGSKTMASLLPRDVATKVQGIARRIDSYASVDAILVDLVTLLEETCKKSLKNSKADPPSFSMRNLQALQLVLDHLPQLHNVYDMETLSKTEADLVHDAEVVHALQKAFHPQRFVRKFAGPLSQLHHCDACHEPFQERQHVFYCTSSEQIHALHWKCTKRKSAAKDSSRQGGSGNAKKKAKSVMLVQQGHWKEVKLPKALPSIGDGVTCSVCRAPVDARGILAGRKEATRMDFEKPTSEFMFGGCFANEMDARTAAAAGLRTSRATIATTSQSAGTVSSGARASSAGKTASRRSASAVSTMGDSDGETSALLGPPKMDRINVRRTTRWLACLAQVIRLVSAAKKKAKEAEVMRIQGEEAASGEQSSTLATVAEPEAEKTIATVEEGAKPEGTTKSDSNPDVEMQETTAETVPRPNETADTNMADLAEPQVSNEAVVSTAKDPHETNLKDSTSTDTKDQVVMTEEPTTPPSAPPQSSLPATALAYLEEAKNVVRPYDVYALSKMESAHRMLEERKGPGLSVLSTLIQEYTRFMYIKHTRAKAKASNEKRKREELEAQEERERERKRIDREAELALKKQMLAMRKKQRT